MFFVEYCTGRCYIFADDIRIARINLSLLEVKNLSIGFRDGSRLTQVVSNVSFELEAGEVLALVGESGCGKSISCLSLTSLLPPRLTEVTADGIIYEMRSGEKVDLAGLSAREMRRVRGGEIAYIFQEPAASLNPVLTIGRQIAEVMELHRPEIDDPEPESIRLLEQVGIPAPKTRLRAFPHELSGGMQQRVMIAMALAGRPRLLIADEPTTALDVTIQAQILELLRKLRSQYDLSVILVTHNLGIVAEIADQVAVMYAGTIVERAATRRLLAAPEHPYTRALLAAVPELGRRKGRLNTIPGVVPRPENYPSGCRFSPRCPALEKASPVERSKCGELPPPVIRIADGHFCRCHKARGGDRDEQ